jgi:branched-subunit amino acid transport protein
MDSQVVLLTMVGMLTVTYLPRLLPLWFFASRRLPPVVISWLRYVPVAVLAAMLLPSLVITEGHLDLRIQNLYLWAALPTFLVAWKTRSLFGSVIVGMLVIAGIRYLQGG